jgi:hypothetical protein
VFSFTENIFLAYGAKRIAKPKPNRWRRKKVVDSRSKSPKSKSKLPTYELMK